MDLALRSRLLTKAAKFCRGFGLHERVVVTNPPFGGMEEDGIENSFPAEFRTPETEGTWHDRRVVAGDRLHSEISVHLIIRKNRSQCDYPS
jgi:hypothetical protein